MSQVSLIASVRNDLREQVSELERMIVSAAHVATGLETTLEKENERSVERTRDELHSIWEILVQAEMALLRVEAKYQQND